MTDKSIEERLGEIEKQVAQSHELLTNLAAGAATLWSAADIARNSGYAVKTVRDVFLKAKNFPRPRMMPGGGKRWLATEVRQYFNNLDRG